MSEAYVHGYHPRENERLHDQAGTLVDLLHSDTAYPKGSLVLEVGCGVGAQTISLAQRSPDARFTSIDVSADSIAEAKRRAHRAGLTNVEFQQTDILASPFKASPSTMFSSVSYWSISRGRLRPCRFSAGSLGLVAPSPSSKAITDRPTSIPIAQRLMGRSSA